MPSIKEINSHHKSLDFGSMEKQKKQESTEDNFTKQKYVYDTHPENSGTIASQEITVP